MKCCVDVFVFTTKKKKKRLDKIHFRRNCKNRCVWCCCHGMYVFDSAYKLRLIMFFFGAMIVWPSSVKAHGLKLRGFDSLKI